MSTKENLTNSNNGWQNIGICYLYSLDKIDRKLRDVYMYIVRQSFGYEEPITRDLSIADIVVGCGVGRTTVVANIKKLEELGHIKTIRHKGFVENGGSMPNRYSPIYPKGYGKLSIKSIKQENDNNKQIKHLQNKLFG